MHPTTGAHTTTTTLPHTAPRIPNTSSRVHTMPPALLVLTIARTHACTHVHVRNRYLKELKFGIGDGALQYYLFNWRCPPANPNQVGLVLL